MPAQPEVISPQAQSRRAGDQWIVEVGGRWSIQGQNPVWGDLAPRDKPPAGVRILVGNLESWDSALLLFLFDAVRWSRESGVALDTGDLPPTMRALLEQLSAAQVKTTVTPRGVGPLSVVGLASLRVMRAGWDIAHFIGECTLSAVHLVLHPQRFRWRDCLVEMQNCGAMALPIVGLISFLVGVTLAYTGAIILRQYGGDIYVADLVGLSMVREMGAMMTAVVLAGRTGAAFAAQIGNMRANEEVDALVTFGFSPVDFLVMPRVVALALMMPLLALYANCLGIIGGMVVALGVLSIPPPAFWIETMSIVDLSDVFTGLIKAGTFGLIVGLCGCLRGLQAERSAAGVGRAATSAVVTAILLLIVADAVYAVIFNILGW